ncbi:hypothetical protein JHK85_020157 [Glycine max]|nr:hypothetical protein JHK85_020157 [Glycine max]KAG5038891.1 hypothetical protein JHK86_019731 [Glycine max]
MAPIFGLTDSPGDWAEPSPGYIVKKNWLYNTKLEEIVSYELVKTVLHFEFQLVSSMNKSREYGFMGQMKNHTII